MALPMIPSSSMHALEGFQNSGQRDFAAGLGAIIKRFNELRITVTVTPTIVVAVVIVQEITSRISITLVLCVCQGTIPSAAVHNAGVAHVWAIYIHSLLNQL